jgi:hypothetical protein
MLARPLAAVSFSVLASLAIFTPASAEQEVQIFNGKDFTGWTKRGGVATYRVEDGVIIGRSAPNTTNTFMTTDKEFGDFILELDFKIDSKDKFNSGIQIRSHSRPEKVKDKDEERERVYGYQVEIDSDPARPWTAGVYFEGGSKDRKAGWLNDLSKNEPAQKARKLDDWNHVKIVAKGREIKTWLNGVPAADFTDTDEKAFLPKGFIALQVHSVGGKNDPLEVRWKNIKLTELD